MGWSEITRLVTPAPMLATDVGDRFFTKITVANSRFSENMKSHSYDFQVSDFAKISFHKNCIRMVFRQCDSIHVVLNCIYNYFHSHIRHIWNVFVLDLRLTSSLRITQHPDGPKSGRSKVRVTRMKSPSYMDSFVTCHIALLIWTKVTFVTFERFFTSVNTFMYIQIRFSTCWKFTKVTFIWTLNSLSIILTRIFKFVTWNRDPRTKIDLSRTGWRSHVKYVRSWLETYDDNTESIRSAKV